MKRGWFSIFVLLGLSGPSLARERLFEFLRPLPPHEVRSQRPAPEDVASRDERRERLRDMREQMRRNREEQAQRASENNPRAAEIRRDGEGRAPEGDASRLRRLSPEERRELRRQLLDARRDPPVRP